MSSQSFIIENLEPDRFPEVQAFYATMDYTYPIDPNSTVVIARNGPQILGAVRLSYEERTQVLRGFMIHPNYERRGIGTLMLHELEKHMGSRDCFCLPHEWLAGFYQQAGFQRVPPESLPPFLHQRWQELKDGPFPYVIAMRRAAVPSTINIKAGEIKSS
jgi:N-acetylglutamate synthase-like GNAT family acetyltransferase